MVYILYVLYRLSLLCILCMLHVLTEPTCKCIDFNTDLLKMTASIVSGISRQTTPGLQFPSTRQMQMYRFYHRVWWTWLLVWRTVISWQISREPHPTPTRACKCVDFTSKNNCQTHLAPLKILRLVKSHIMTKKWPIITVKQVLSHALFLSKHLWNLFHKRRKLFITLLKYKNMKFIAWIMTTC